MRVRRSLQRNTEFIRHCDMQMQFDCPNNADN